MYRETILSIFIAVIVWSPPAAAQIMAKLCFTTHADYTGSGRALTGGTAEDYWTGTSNAAARGIRVIIRKDTSSGALLASTYAGDGLGAGDPGLGCSPAFDTGGAAYLWFAVYSYGKIQDNWLYVRNENASDAVLSYTGSVVTGNGGTITLPVTGATESERDIWRAYNAAAYALYRHAGGMTSQVYTIGYDTNHGTNLYAHANRRVDLSDWGGNRKFVIVHELGHALLHEKLDDDYLFASCAFNESPCNAASGGHSMGSKEYEGCAMSEGFAHFYAADVFNSHSQANCAFRYYKSEFSSTMYKPLAVRQACSGVHPVVDCESNLSDPCHADAFIAVAHMEQECVSGWNGRGSEIDWLRQFWDMHTHVDQDPPPSFTEIVNWIRDSGSWTSTSTYEVLDQGANSQGGIINLTWDYYKDLNGINH